MLRLTSLLLIVLLLVQAAGCSTRKPVIETDPDDYPFIVGYTTKTGEVHAFDLVPGSPPRIQAEILSGPIDGTLVRVPLSEVDQLWIRRPASRALIALLVGGVFVAIVAAYWILGEPDNIEEKDPPPIVIDLWI